MTTRYHLDAYARAGRLDDLAAELARLDVDTQAQLAQGRRYVPQMLAVVQSSKAQERAAERRLRALKAAVAARQPQAAQMLARTVEPGLAQAVWGTLLRDRAMATVDWATLDAVLDVIHPGYPVRLRAVLPALLAAHPRPIELDSAAIRSLTQPLDEELTALQVLTLELLRSKQAGPLATALNLVQELQPGRTVTWCSALIGQALLILKADHPAAETLFRHWDALPAGHEVAWVPHIDRLLSDSREAHPSWTAALVQRLAHHDQAHLMVWYGDSPHAIRRLDTISGGVEPAVRHAWARHPAAGDMPQLVAHLRADDLRQCPASTVSRPRRRA